MNTSNYCISFGSDLKDAKDIFEDKVDLALWSWSDSKKLIDFKEWLGN